ncbi:GntR family transcriptional regulator [Clostridium sediminicola]|uniref:GntR family transcriptional regulator n=1 Tax=Clostridium sediminicola TaxID=3114879 RepID=UPI0031F1DAF1
MKANYLPPLYIQIKNFLIEKILSNQYDEYSKLPSERELSEKFNVSRMTARNALNEIVNEGYAFRETGRGTFVVGKRFRRDFVKLESFSKRLRSSGITDISTEVVDKKVIEADSFISEKLNVLIGTKCYKLVRLRVGNKKTMSLEYSYMSADKLPHLLDYDFSKLSLFQTIEEKYFCSLRISKSTLEMGYLNKYNAKLLNVKEGSAAFIIKAITYDDKDNVIEYCESFNRGDLCVFSYELVK